MNFNNDREEPTKYPHTVSLEQYYKRTSIHVTHSYQVKCNECNGSGYKFNLENNKHNSMTISLWTPYERSINKKENICGRCLGEGMVAKTKHLHIIVPETKEDIKTLEKNNISIDLQIKQHPKYYIQERTNNLCLIKPKTINLNNALCGGGFILNHFNEDLHIEPNLKVIKFNEFYKIPGKGLFRRGSEKRGDLLVKFNVIMPGKLNRATIKSIYELLPPNVDQTKHKNGFNKEYKMTKMVKLDDWDRLGIDDDNVNEEENNYEMADNCKQM